MRVRREECFHAVSGGVSRSVGFVGRKAEGITVLERFLVVLKSPEQGQCLSCSDKAVKSGPEKLLSRHSRITWMLLFTLL